MERQDPHLRSHAGNPPRPARGRAYVLRFVLVCIPLLLPLCAGRWAHAQAEPADTRIFLSEVLTNPRAVPDSGGEWIELYNLGPTALNLNGWQVRVQSGYSATLVWDAWLEPGGYGVLAELADPLENGGVTPFALLPGLVLEDVDALELCAPDGNCVESVAWGEYPRVEPGHSLERTDFGGAPTWAVSTAALARIGRRLGQSRRSLDATADAHPAATPADHRTHGRPRCSQ